MDNPQHGATPNKPDDAFTIRKRFPGEASTSPPSGPAPAPPSSRVFSRVVLPLIVFVLVIGGVAWIMQYMPNRKTAAPETQTPKLATTEELLINFDEITAIWDKKDRNYVAEFERTTDGHFDFPFENARDEDVFVGLFNVSCVCSSVKVAITPSTGTTDLDKLNWKSLEVSKDFDTAKTAKVPSRARGVVRVMWKGGKLTDPVSRLSATLWMQPEKRPNVRQGQSLETAVRIVPAVMFDPTFAKVGELANRGVAKSTFDLWSATRSQIELTLEPENADELIEIDVRPLNKEEQDDLEARLKKKLNSHVKSAWRAEVTLYEQKGGRQLPQGPVHRNLQIIADGEKLTGPSLEGFVAGEVRVGAANSGGEVKLERFPARSGIKKQTTLWTDPSVGLVLEGHRPTYVKVNLSENKKDSTANQRRWDLHIEVPPGYPVGPMPDDAAVILKTQSASPRQIYIPIRGSATPG